MIIAQNNYMVAELNRHHRQEMEQAQNAWQCSYQSLHAEGAHYAQLYEDLVNLRQQDYLDFCELQNQKYHMEQHIAKLKHQNDQLKDEKCQLQQNKAQLEDLNNQCYQKWSQAAIKLHHVKQH